jgi:1,4-alpha-glucan branching enzyme
MVSFESNGHVTFRVFMPRAGAVAVAGNFTDWRAGALSMTREDTGWWTLRVPVRTGDHEFAYLIDGERWLADFAAHGLRRDQFGSWVSLLMVEAPAGSMRLAA